ncbi:transposase [Dehalococcoidia bacterium]|nr:transposase [Dehalococcoidia bacterium]
MCYTHYGMFVKEIIKRNPGYDKTFTYHRLMESVRTPRGPRHRKIIDLGKLDLAKDDWKTLANRIEEILCGQQTFFTPPDDIESLAHHYAQLIRQREMHSLPIEQEKEPDWETVDLKSLSQSGSRTIGGESVGYDAFQRLGFPRILSDLGFNRDQRDRAALLIIGRLLHPGSERKTAIWAREISALDELMGTDFEHLSNNALYRTSDQLLKHRYEIERHLSESERSLYNLGETIILYDLTNTYLEGSAHESSLAHRARSKEKRYDCPLLTLALVVDEDGFLKKSKVLPGNVSEPGTLKAFLEAYDDELKQKLPLFKERPTVVIDAGVGTQANLRLIRSMGFHYITMSRSKLSETPTDGLVLLKKERDCTIKAKRIEHDGGVILYCESSACGPFM